MTGRDLDPTLKRLLGSGEPEIGCDECFEQLDRYVELQLAGAPADALVPGLRAHLVGCPRARKSTKFARAAGTRVCLLNACFLKRGLRCIRPST